jgi:hypothetical protein
LTLKKWQAVLNITYRLPEQVELLINLGLLVFSYRIFDIIIFNGQIPRIIRATHTTGGIRSHAETFLATHAPGAYRAIFFLGTHQQILI